MRTFGKRLDKLEERKAFQQFLEREAELAARSCDELTFFSLHGYWPGGAEVSELPPNQEYVVYGIRTTIVNEWADKR